MALTILDAALIGAPPPLQEVTVEELAQALHEAGRVAVQFGLVVNRVEGQPFKAWEEITPEAQEGRRVQATQLLIRFSVTRRTAPPSLAEQERWAEADRQALRAAIPGHPALDSCTMPECAICAARDCPHEEPLHYDKDGCPACHAPTPPPARSEPPGASPR